VFGQNIYIASTKEKPL